MYVLSCDATSDTPANPACCKRTCHTWRCRELSCSTLHNNATQPSPSLNYLRSTVPQSPGTYGWVQTPPTVTCPDECGFAQSQVLVQVTCQNDQGDIVDSALCVSAGPEPPASVSCPATSACFASMEHFQTPAHSHVSCPYCISHIRAPPPPLVAQVQSNC